MFLAPTQPDLHSPRLPLHIAEVEAPTRDALRSALPQHAPTASLTDAGIGNLPTVPSFALRYNGIGHSEGALVSRNTFILASSALVIHAGLFSTVHDLAHHTLTASSGMALVLNVFLLNGARHRRRAERAAARQAEAEMAAWEARNPRPH